MNVMIAPSENERTPLPQDVELFDVFGETVQQRIIALAQSIDELNEKSNILEYEWVFDREDWHVYDKAKYGRCRFVSINKDDDGTYTVVAAKAWEEDKDLIISGQLSPVQYVRYVSPKVQIAHFSQGASRQLDRAMGEWSAQFRGGDVPYDVDPHEYLYEAAFGHLWRSAVELPEVDVYDEYRTYSRDARHLDIILQAKTIKVLRLNSVRKPAWEWGVFRREPKPDEYTAAINETQQRTEKPDLSQYRYQFDSYDKILQFVKSKLSQLWNERYNIDDLFFFSSPGMLDPEMAGLYQTRFDAVIAEIEKEFRDLGYDPTQYQREVYKWARVRVSQAHFENKRATQKNPVNWSDQTTVEALAHVLDNLGRDLAEDALDNSLFVKSLYGEMPPMIQPLSQKMAQISFRDTVSTSDKVLVNQFVVLPKKLSVGSGGEITNEQPKTMREWVESINEWSLEQGDPFDYLYYIHKKPDGTVLYAELRIQPGDTIDDIVTYTEERSSKVLLANFYPAAIAYLQKYHARKVLNASDYHGAIHIKHFGDQPMNDGKNKMIEFVHNA